jgi:hypothetical protein
MHSNADLHLISEFSQPALYLDPTFQILILRLLLSLCTSYHHHLSFILPLFLRPWRFLLKTWLTCTQYYSDNSMFQCPLSYVIMNLRVINSLLLSEKVNVSVARLKIAVSVLLSKYGSNSWGNSPPSESKETRVSQEFSPNFWNPKFL